MALMTRVNKQETINLAKVKRAYGIKGELLILPFTPKARWIYNLSQIILTKNTKKPDISVIGEQSSVSFSFTIEYCRSHKDGYIVKLQNCDDRTKAEKWHGAFVSIPLSTFTSKPGENIYLIELKNFIVIDAGEQIGPVVSFSSNGYQDLIQVKKNGHTYDIPLVKDFLISIDWEEKHIYMNLPDGLLNETAIKSMKIKHLLKNKTLKSKKKAKLFAI